jgi:anti-anti-sigma factor
MDITERIENDIYVFTIEGRIDSAGAIALEDSLQATVEEGHHKMVLDLAKVQYINSAALRTLADIITQNREHGGDLRLAALTPKVKRVFQIVGFDRFSTIFDTLEEALVNFD